MTTLMDIITGCENQLGWQPAPGVPMWKARSVEIGKLKKALASGQHCNASIDNLALALEYSRRRRMPITSPSVLIHRIADAVALTYTPAPVSDITQQVTDAIRWEQELDDADAGYWIYRLMRSQGDGRLVVLQQWTAAGRG